MLAAIHAALATACATLADAALPLPQAPATCSAVQRTAICLNKNKIWLQAIVDHGHVDALNPLYHQNRDISTILGDLPFLLRHPLMGYELWRPWFRPCVWAPVVCTSTTCPFLIFLSPKSSIDQKLGRARVAMFLPCVCFLCPKVPIHLRGQARPTCFFPPLR